MGVRIGGIEFEKRIRKIQDKTKNTLFTDLKPTYTHAQVETIGSSRSELPLQHAHNTIKKATLSGHK